MEKRKAHYDLNAIKVIVAQRGMNAFTRAAQDNARLMGLDGQAALEVVLGLQRGMLFKSMATHTDSTVWQDVYHAPCPNGKTAYIRASCKSRDNFHTSLSSVATALPPA